MLLRHLDLFSGIGGFALAADWVWGEEHEIVSFVEIDPFCQKVLKKHWPDVPIHGDIKTFDAKAYSNVDLVTGGFPCQPFSVAGERTGTEDDRYLWPEMLQIIRTIQPAWVIGENVTGILNMGFSDMLAELETSGFECQSFIIPACAVGAYHRRDRVWFVANSKLFRRVCGVGENNVRKKVGGKNKAIWSKNGFKSTLAPVGDKRIFWEWTYQSRMARVVNGIPNHMDRLKSHGNAIVPQVVVPIMQAIKEIERY